MTAYGNGSHLAVELLRQAPDSLRTVTGLVDAFSYLRLGHVFVANMTGNVVFLGFGLAGVGEISIAASLLAVVAFVLGATVGGRWAAGRAVHRGYLLAAATSVQAGVVLVASVIASTADVQTWAVRLTLIGLLAVAMGGQKRRGAAAGRTRPDHHGAGGVLLRWVALAAPLWLAAALLVACAAGAYLAASRPQSQTWR